MGISVGMTVTYSKYRSEYVLGVGGSIGVGVSATLIDINLNYGKTTIANPWRNGGQIF